MVYRRFIVTHLCPFPKWHTSTTTPVNYLSPPLRTVFLSHFSFTLFHKGLHGSSGGLCPRNVEGSCKGSGVCTHCWCLRWPHVPQHERHWNMCSSESSVVSVSPIRQILPMLSDPALCLSISVLLVWSVLYACVCNGIMNLWLLSFTCIVIATPCTLFIM